MPLFPQKGGTKGQVKKGSEDSQGSQVLKRKPIVLHSLSSASAAPSAFGFSPGGGDTSPVLVALL